MELVRYGKWPPENFNVAKDNPQIVTELNAAYLTWAKQNDVVVWNETLAKKAAFPTDNK